MSTNWERVGTAQAANGTEAVSERIRARQAQARADAMEQAARLGVPVLAPGQRATTGQKILAIGILLRTAGQLLTLIVWGGFGLLLLCGGLYLAAQFVLALAASLH